MAISAVVKTLREVNAVMEHGDQKYGENAWLDHKPDLEKERRQHIDAMYRHLLRFLHGEEIDTDSGHPALAHVVARGLMALEFDQQIRGV